MLPNCCGYIIYILESQLILFLLPSDTQNQKLKQENERLTKEINRLRQMLDQSQQDFGAVGGIDLSEDTISLDAQSTDGSSNRVDRMEAELKLAREQILRKSYHWAHRAEIFIQITISNDFLSRFKN